MKLRNIELPSKEISELCQHWHIIKLSLFGSVLRDDFRLDSDIDVLVEFEPEYTPGFFKLHHIQEELSTLLGGRRIDLVTSKFLNHRIRDDLRSVVDHRILAEAETCYVAQR